MGNYVVYQHNVPKVSDEGKVVPIAPNQSKEFTDLDEAKKFGGEQKDKFDRVTLMEIGEENRRMVERYMDGEHIIPEPKKELEPAAAEATEPTEAESSEAEATESEEDAN